MAFIPPENNCSKCRFSNKERPQANLLQDVLVCRWGPPTPMLIPIGPGQASLQPVWPIVGEHGWCHRFEAKSLPLPGN